MALNEDTWKGLSAAAKIYYLHLKSRYNGSNNGAIRLPYSAMKSIRGCSTNRTISKAIKELESKGWIKVKEIGGLHRHYNLFKLTFRYEFYAHD
jgi:hypothetical protein